MRIRRGNRQDRPGDVVSIHHRQAIFRGLSGPTRPAIWNLLTCCHRNFQVLRSQEVGAGIDQVLGHRPNGALAGSAGTNAPGRALLLLCSPMSHKAAARSPLSKASTIPACRA